MIRKVFDISDRNLADVPRRLRMLADELEAESGGKILACVVVIETAETMGVHAFGSDADRVRTTGLLLAAATKTTMEGFGVFGDDEWAGPAA